MLIKEETMKRLLIATLALVLLLTTFGTAFAQDSIDVVLGEVWTFGSGPWFPFQRVDTYMYRPSTEAGWPHDSLPFAGAVWAVYPEGQMNRQSWPAWAFANELGLYYAEFMLPRDEAYFPCGYPYKWQCNSYMIDPANPFGPPIREYHSPWWQADFEAGLAWPYVDWIVLDETDGDFEAAWLYANPQDTIHPVSVIQTDGIDEFEFELQVLGYFWKVSDLEDGFYWIYYP
jgi:hypothetical protein